MRLFLKRLFFSFFLNDLSTIEIIARERQMIVRERESDGQGEEEG